MGLTRQIAAFAVVILLPVVMIVNGVQIFAQDRFVSFEYQRHGLEADLQPLAQRGLDSIQPWHTGGIDLIRSAKLPNGEAAFTERELLHMQDVRNWLGRFYLAHAIALALLALAAIAVKGRILSLLRKGAMFTLGLAAAVGLYAVVDFQSFFTHFHEIFFEPGTWQFSSEDTLIRLYPNELWQDAAFGIAGLTLAQTLFLIGFARYYNRSHPE